MKTLRILFALCAAAWLVPPLVAQPSNTMVRFHFYRGTTVIGDVDVELFDYEKPITVSNFLRYVRSGAYHNLLLHRCVPQFVIQAGASWTPAPLSSAVYTAGQVPSFGDIANEFQVGARLSNTFGTIAMARAVGNSELADYGTNSANAQWFFNLADNSSSLDTNYGGFTVFGRVVSGTNVLHFFNHPSPTLNIFGSLPVSNPTRICSRIDYADCPRYNELYHIKISVLPIADIRPPTVTITSPAANAKVTGSPLIVTGKATDDRAVDSIFYSIAGRPFTNAPAGSNWSFATEIPAGFNYIYLSSVDAAGQRSAPVGRTIFYSVLEPLHLNIAGNGTVIGATDGQHFEIGRFTTLTAKPSPGHLFAGWTGSSIQYFLNWPVGALVHYRTTDQFYMISNATLTATFVTNPFAPMKGTYSGMFYNTNAPNQPSGLMTFTVTELGKVTGKLNVLGRSVPFSGALTPYGESNIRISAGAAARPFGASNNWFAVFSIDVTNRSDLVFASQHSGTGYPYIWDGETFNSALNATRVRVGTVASPSPYAGRHTLCVPGNPNRALLVGNDFINPSNFVMRLRDHLDPISQFLWDQFSAEARSVLTNTASTTTEQLIVVITTLNEVIQGASIYDPARFSGVVLGQETVSLHGQNPAGTSLLRLNRLLLQDAYPQDLYRIDMLHPEGDSFGAVTVAVSGVGTAAGTMADGTSFTMSAPVTTNGLWPFYTGLYGARGWLCGWTQFDLSNPTNNVRGDMRWRKNAFPGKPYTNGFEVFPTLFGSTYTTATATNRVLQFTDGVVSLTGPNVFPPLTNYISLNINNTVVNRSTSTNKITFTLVKPNGLFSGTVKPVGETRTIPFKGAVFQRQNYGSGYYVSTNQSGRVYFGE